VTLSPGITYWFQVITWDFNTVQFSLSNLGPVSASIWFYPDIPVRGRLLTFDANVYDRSFVSLYFESCEWQYGDGASATGCHPDHVYTELGDYTVELTAATSDSYPSDNSFIALPTKVSGARSDADDVEEAPTEAVEMTTSIYLPAVANGQ